MSVQYPGPDMPAAYQAPRNEIEQSIADIWQDIIGIEAIGVYDNFFDLGGDSLLALNLLARLRQAFNVEIPLRQFLQASTIASIAECLEEKLLQLVESAGSDKVSQILDAIE